MNRRRVVITGLGVVTSLGETADEMWDNLCAAKSGFEPSPGSIMSTYPVRFGAECTNFDVLKYASEVAKYTDDKLQPKRLGSVRSVWHCRRADGRQRFGNGFHPKKIPTAAV